MSIDCTSAPSCLVGQAILRRSPAAAPPCGQRSSWRGRDQVDLRSRLVMQLARRTAPTRQVRYGSTAVYPRLARERQQWVETGPSPRTRPATWVAPKTAVHELE